MSDIHDQHAAAFASVSAYVITLKGERVATIAFRHPRDGAGRLWTYVHWLGTPMVRGFASGGGYDKHSAACASAIHKACAAKHALLLAEPGSPMDAFRAALCKDDGATWDRQLRDAGFDVLQAV